jgi:hypothetical protein
MSTTKIADGVRILQRRHRTRLVSRIYLHTLICWQKCVMQVAAVFVLPWYRLISSMLTHCEQTQQLAGDGPDVNYLGR